jgi:hypothetical protein
MVGNNVIAQAQAQASQRGRGSLSLSDRQQEYAQKHGAKPNPEAESNIGVLERDEGVHRRKGFAVPAYSSRTVPIEQPDAKGNQHSAQQNSEQVEHTHNEVQDRP